MSAADGVRNRSVVILISMLLVAFVPFGPAAGETTITSFTGQGESVALQLNSSQAVSVNITLDRNTTIQTASFSIQYDAEDESPGEMRLDIGQDGQNEWRFGGGNYGGVGQQTMFVNGANTTTASLSGGAAWAVTDGFLLPDTAQISAADVNISFWPTMAGGFLPTGHIDQMMLGDVDADGLPEPILLKRGHMLSNGSTQPHIGWADWTAGGGWGAIIWTPTCSNATDMVIGDYNNDSLADVITIDWLNGVLCLHDSNLSGWNAFSNISLGPDLVGVDLVDMDGDLDDDLVYALSDADLNVRLWQSNAFATAINITVQAVNGGGGSTAATLTSLAAGMFWPGVSNGTVAVTSDDGQVSLWNLSAANSTHVWTPTEISFDGIDDSIEAFDADGDGDLDLFGDAPMMGTTLAIFNGSNYSTSTDSSPPSLFNHTFADWNGNGTLDMIMVDPGSSDNNDSTITGGLGMLTIQNGNISTSVSTTLQAHTSPRILRVGDIDGDGGVDHLVAAGEQIEGVWVAGWHAVEWDLNGDGVPEASMEGYAGRGGGAPEPLFWLDEDGSFTDDVKDHLSSASTVSDLYGIDYGNYTPAARSDGDGSLIAMALNIQYSVIMTVDVNPTSGDLASALNRMMRPGNGSFDVELPMFATANGSVTLQSLAIQHILGCTCDLPATPLLNLINKSDQHVYFDWTGTSHDEPTFIEYQVFRVDPASPIIISMPFGSTNESRYVDLEVTANTTYDYAVMALHEDGVYSNLSNILQVVVPAVPPPPPDVTPPARVKAVMALDVPADEGGNISVGWTIGVDADLANHLVFVHTAQFSNSSLLEPVANLSATTNNTYVQSTSTVLDPTGSTVSASRSLTAGDSVWVAVVGMDDAGNMNQTVVSVGPVLTKNDSARPTTLTLLVSSDETNGTTAVARSGSPIELRTTLLSEGTALSGRDVDFSIDDGSGIPVTLSATTDLNGIASLSWADWATFQSAHGPLLGALTVAASVPDATYGLDAQTLLGSSDSTAIQSRVNATLSLADSSVQLDSAGTGSVTVRLLAQHAADQAVLDGLHLSWSLANATAGTMNATGEATLDEQGAAMVAVDLPGGGEITFSIGAESAWLDTASTSVQATLLPMSIVDNGGPDDEPEPTVDTTTLVPASIQCGTGNWTMPSDPVQLAASAAANSRTCTIANPNEVRVFVDLDLSVSVIGITFSASTGTTFNINSNDSITVVLTPEPGATLRNGTLTVEVSFSATDRVDEANSTEIQFLFSDLLVDDDSETSETQKPPPEGTRGTNTTTFAIVGALGLLMVILGLTIGRRMLMADLEDDEEEEEYFDPDEIKSAIQQTRDIPQSRPLHEVVMHGGGFAEDEDLRGSGSGAASGDIKRSVSMKKPKRLLDGASPATTLSAVLEKARGNGEVGGADEVGYVDEYSAEDQYEGEHPESDYEGEYGEHGEESAGEPAGESGEPDLSDDPSYSIDDDGTEWWKDEDDVWWWRGPDDEDWLEYE